MKMKRVVAVSVIALFVGSFVSISLAQDPPKTGKQLFEQNCSPCHPNGSNIVNPAFTLHKKDREVHGVKTTKDIIGKMRNPGPGMTKFSKKMISDKDAKKIAEYIMKTFK
jgi:cytochrome c6